MNGYTICSFKNNGSKEYLVLDVILEVEKNKALVQGFKSKGGCNPFPLMFSVKRPEEEMLKEAFSDGVRHMQMIEGWQGEGCDETLEALADNPPLLNFIKANCKSKILALAIENIFNKNA